MKRFLQLGLMTSLLVSCSFIPKYQQPNVEVPERWRGEVAKDMAQNAANGAAHNLSQAIPAQWWTLYQDPVLDDLMTVAQRQNPELRAGLERVNQSRAALRIAGASLLPSADASLGAGRSRTNPKIGPTVTENNLSAGLAISYELDLFGRNRAQVASARASLKSQKYQQESLKLVTLGDVASAYFNLIAARERVRIAENNLKNSRDVLHIIDVRVQTGLDSNLELAQQRVAVSSSEANLASLKQLQSTYQNALAVLIGRAPQDFDFTPDRTLFDVPVPHIAPEQPAVLLERRPDIHVAEQNLMVANANIGAARAAFFPALTLGGNASIAGTAFGDPSTSILSLASSLTAPIFQGGRLQGGLDQANAAQRELIENYRGTVLTAFREVEDALAATRAASEREVALRTARDEARRAYDISRKRYDVGTIDFQTLLDTQAALLSAEDLYARALEQKLSSSVDLVKALGGGWRPPLNSSASIDAGNAGDVSVAKPDKRLQ